MIARSSASIVSLSIDIPPAYAHLVDVFELFELKVLSSAAVVDLKQIVYLGVVQLLLVSQQLLQRHQPTEDVSDLLMGALDGLLQLLHLQKKLLGELDRVYLHLDSSHSWLTLFIHDE